jgi:hypothetical protein
MAVTENGIRRLEATVSELKEKLGGLEAEQQTARQAAEQAEAAWRSALADDRLGEGDEGGVKKARTALDSAQEDVLALDGAVAEVGRRLSAAEAELLEARLAALVKRADRGAANLGRCVAELLELDVAAGKVRERMQALTADLLQVKEEHRGLDREGRSPGEIGGLDRKLWDGLAQSPAGLNVSGHLLLAHVELAGFISNWRQGPGRRPDRILGATEG